MDKDTTTYAITFRGEAGKAIEAAFPDLEIVSGGGCTTLRASCPDQAALHGLIDRVGALGLELVSLATIDARADRARTEVPDAP